MVDTGLSNSKWFIGLNGFIRFGLEITALIATGSYFWHKVEGLWGNSLAFGIPLLMVVLWGVFNVPNDPSRSGKAPVVVPGFVRLLIEILVLGTGCYFLFLQHTSYAWVYLSLMLFHYAVSYPRIVWLLKQ